MATIKTLRAVEYITTAAAIMLLLLSSIYGATRIVKLTQENKEIVQMINKSTKTLEEVNKSLSTIKEGQENNSIDIKNINTKHDEIKKQIDSIKNRVDKIETSKSKKDTTLVASRGNNYRGEYLGNFQITAYDLSVQSCGVPIGGKDYGITANGASLIDKSRTESMSVAADPRVIPMGSKIRLTFNNNKYSRFNGIYTVNNTGGAIKGNILDLFMGDFNSNKTAKQVWDFGRTSAKVEFIK